MVMSRGADKVNRGLKTPRREAQTTPNPERHNGRIPFSMRLCSTGFFSVKFLFLQVNLISGDFLNSLNLLPLQLQLLIVK